MGTYTTRLTIDRVMDMPNPVGRGTSCLVLMSDEDGNRLKWKTSAAGKEIFDGVGTSLLATFSVKEHGDYKGTRQTSVVRLQVLTLPEPEARQVDLEQPAATRPDDENTGP